VHKLGHGDGGAIDDVGVEHARHASFSHTGNALRGLDKRIVQIDRVAAGTVQTLDCEDAIESGQAANTRAIGVNPALGAKTLLKFVPAKLARLGLIADDGEPGCSCHRG